MPETYILVLEKNILKNKKKSLKTLFKKFTVQLSAKSNIKYSFSIHSEKLRAPGIFLRETNFIAVTSPE